MTVGIFAAVVWSLVANSPFPSIGFSKNPLSAALDKLGGMSATLLMVNSRRQDI